MNVMIFNTNILYICLICKYNIYVSMHGHQYKQNNTFKGHGQAKETNKGDKPIK